MIEGVDLVEFKYRLIFLFITTTIRSDFSIHGRSQIIDLVGQVQTHNHPIKIISLYIYQ